MRRGRQSYIGVTGFMKSSEVADTLALVPSRTTRWLMVGILVSSKTLVGHTNPWLPNRYPKRECINILTSSTHPRAFNLIHYHTDEPSTLADQLAMAVELSSPQLHGFQLNVRWPDPGQIKKFYQTVGANYHIVLQVGSGAFKDIDHSPAKLARKVAEYRDLIDYVLLDPSGGKGIPLNPEMLEQYIVQLDTTVHEIFYGVAGGLDFSNLDLIAPLAKHFPILSIDAEGKLRTPQPRDQLEMGAVRRYIQSAFRTLK